MALLYQAPPLSIWQAHLLAGLCAVCYVGVLYVFQNTRIAYSDNAPRQPTRNRDDPEVIRARMIAVSLSTIASCALVAGVVLYLSGNKDVSLVLSSAATRLGFSFNSHLIQSCFIAPVLFAGPLYVMFLSDSLPLQRFWSVKLSLEPIFRTWIGWRNYIIAPITEEVVFRACLLAFYHMAGASSQKLVFLSPLWFGVAHVHHGVELYNRLGRTSAAAQQAIITVIVQLVYTTMFGCHSAYLFLRTGSIIPPIVSHTFCNIMGLPGFGSDASRFPHRRIPIIVTYIFGLLGYIYTITRWTEVHGSLYWTPSGHETRF